VGASWTGSWTVVYRAGDVTTGLLWSHRVRASGGGGVGEPAPEGGGAQAGEGAGLSLLHGLAGEPEGVADLLQGARGLPVEAVVGGEDGALAQGEGGAHGGGDLLSLGFVVGAGGGGVGKEVTQGGDLGVAHGQVEGDRGGQGGGEGVHAGAGEAGGGEVGGGKRATCRADKGGGAVVVRGKRSRPMRDARAGSPGWGIPPVGGRRAGASRCHGLRA